MTTSEFTNENVERLVVESRLRVLRELAAEADLVTCLDATVRPAEPPQALADFGFARVVGLSPGSSSTNTGDPDPAPIRMLDRVAPEDQVTALDLLGVSRRCGFGSGKVRLAGAEGAYSALHIVNMIDQWGVYVIVWGGTTATASGLTAEPAAISPRRLVHRRDVRARFIDVDENTYRVLGWRPEELLDRPAIEYLHPDDLERALESWLAMISGRDSEPVRLRYRAKSGSHHWFEVHNTNRLEDPEYGCVISELIDIDDEMRALAQVRDSELQFSALAESLPVGVVHFDSGGRVVFANRWMTGLTGKSKEGMADLGWVLPIDRIVLRQAIEDAVAGVRGQIVDIGILADDGEPHSCHVRLEPLALEGGAGHVIGSVEDVTSSLTLKDQLRAQASSDELTELPNRRALREWLSQRTNSDGLAIYFVDLDGFKLVNDALGHDAGDELLTAVADNLRTAVRPSDLVARLGGDEFVVACLGVRGHDDAGIIAGRLLDAVSSPVVVAGNTTTPACSIGVTMGQPDTADIEQLIGDADIAMYGAKQAGGRQYAFFEEEARKDVQLQHRIANDLRHAIGTRELELHLQPIVDLGTGLQAGAEALIRWRHPELGMVPPVQFIPVAERTRLMESLGAWILDDACRLGARLVADSPSSRIAINVSPRQLAPGEFVGLALGAMDRHGIDPANVVFEVTETVFLDMSTNVLATLTGLVEAGARVALDDFGTGYSSLNHLRLMPAQIVKIDRSYTNDLGVDARTTAIVEAVVGLAAQLGQEVVVEGIETEEQVTLLKDMGITYGQGYHLGRPVSEDDFFA